MMNDFVTNHFSNNAICEICGAHISFPDFMNGKDQVCRSFECQRIISQKATMPPLVFESHLRFQRKLETERREKEAALKKYRDEAAEREADENQRILKLVSGRHTALSTKNIHLVVIPTGMSRSIPLDEERIEKYRQHLEEIVQTARNQVDSTNVDIGQDFEAYERRISVDEKLDGNPYLRTISDQLCGMCKGGCCTSGGDHAYLSAFTIRRYFDANPGLSDSDMQDLYLSNISSESIAGACINQTTSGCSLPKELRSDICSAFYCDSLKSFQNELFVEDEPGTVLAIQRAGTCFNAYGPGVCNDIVSVALVDEKDIQMQDVSMENIRDDQQEVVECEASINKFARE